MRCNLTIFTHEKMTSMIEMKNSQAKITNEATSASNFPNQQTHERNRIPGQIVPKTAAKPFRIQ